MLGWAIWILIIICCLGGVLIGLNTNIHIPVHWGNP